MIYEKVAMERGEEMRLISKYIVKIGYPRGKIMNLFQHHAINKNQLQIDCKYKVKVKTINVLENERVWI